GVRGVAHEAVVRADGRDDQILVARRRDAALAFCGLAFAANRRAARERLDLAALDRERARARKERARAIEYEASMALDHVRAGEVLVAAAEHGAAELRGVVDRIEECLLGREVLEDGARDVRKEYRRACDRERDEDQPRSLPSHLRATLQLLLVGVAVKLARRLF